MRTSLRAVVFVFAVLALPGCALLFDNVAVVRQSFFEGSALEPGAVGVLWMEDGCQSSEVGCSSTEELERIVGSEIVDETVIESEPWNAARGRELSDYVAYPIRGRRPGSTLVRLTGEFDDGTTRTAETELAVAVPRRLTADVRSKTWDCEEEVLQRGPSVDQGLVRRVYVGDEQELFVRQWGLDQSGNDVSVTSHDTPDFFDVEGAPHTLETTRFREWPPTPWEHSLRIDEPGDVTVVSTLPEIESNDLVVRAIGEADIVAFSMRRGRSAQSVWTGHTRTIRPRPLDGGERICGVAPFLNRLVVVTSTPDLCLLRLDDGTLVEESGVRFFPPEPHRGFVVYGVSPGTCMLRMKFPQMASWHEHAIEVYASESNEG